MKSTLSSADRYDRDIDGLTDDPLSRIAARIRPGETILDVGCSTGLLGRSLTTKRCNSDGIDLDPEAAERASAFYRNVIVANLESAHLLDYFMQRGYDCIVCADVLEHLRSPENLLRQFRDLLKPGGRIFLSIPNIAYAGVIAELIGGEFEYRPNGLLDETHLRFFTRNSLLRMIAQEGYGVACIDTIRREIPLTEFRQTYAAQLSPSMAETIYAQADALTYQFIVELSVEERLTLEGQHVPQSLSRPRFGVQLFWSFDRFNYDETNSLRQSAMLGEDPQTVVFSLPDLPQQPFSLRIDPADREGVLRFYSLKLKTNKGRVIRRFGLDELFSVAVCNQVEIWPEVFGDSILLTGDDPYLILTGEHCFGADPGRLSIVELVIGSVQMPDVRTWASKTKILVSEVARRAEVERDAALAERARQIDSLKFVVGERDAGIANLTQAVAERDRQIDKLNQAVAGRDRQTDKLNQTLAGRERRIASLNRSVMKRDGQIDRLNHVLHAMRSSTSWRVTAPLRALRSVLGRMRPRYRARALVSRMARFVYRRLPLSTPQRLRLKHFLFCVLSRFVRHTGAYQAWVARTEPAPIPAVRPALNPKASVPVVAHTEPGAIPAAPDPAQATHPSPGILAPGILESMFAESSAEHVPITQTPGIHTAVKAIAFYLPQFHPIPENDAWWGKGFTEWTNVTRARPQFLGHYQPHLPGELGFYDLRLLDIQQRQIELARTYGIHGFCYHHYWFAGRRLLDRPFNEVLANKQLDLPFCLCWANENWSRRWDGLDREILISQHHSPEDDLAFIQDIEPALRDKRYIRVRGRPLLIVYRPARLPDAKATAERWRDYCRSAGIGEIYLASTHAFDSRDPRDIGFDAAIEFPPNNTPAPVVTDQVQVLNPAYRGVVHDYRYFLENSRRYVKPPFTLFRCVMPSWDNEARKPSQGITFLHSSPAAYAEWLDDVCRSTTETFSGDERIIFVNAWNEWAEGCHLEPDRRFGYAYLQATRDVLARYPADRSRKIVYVSHDAAYNGAQLLSLHIVKGLCEQLGFQVEVILLAGGPLAPDFARCARVHDFSVPGCTSERQAEVIRELFDSGARAAITSTTVSGALVVPLKRQGFRVVSLVHELPGLIRARKLEGSLENIARFADRVVFPTQGVSEKVCDLSPISLEKVIIRPQGLLHRNTHRDRTDEARQLVRTEFGLPEKVRIVMGMGYGDHRKGVDLFVEVALVTIEKRSDVCFVWVGNSDPELLGPIERKISERNAGSRILFPGFRPYVDVYLSGADVFLLSSREDPFPSVVLEAMDAGLPVIGYEGAGGFCELFQDSGGLAVPWGDIAATVTAVERLLDDDLLWQRVSTCAKAMVGDGFQFLDYVYDLASYAGEHCPKVSVIIPNYNYERYLSQRLLSVVRQSYRPYEILFLDDCSTDGSVGVAERILGSSDIPFRVIRNTTNQGTFKQWIRGIREARGDLVWIAEADDFCEERFLEVLGETFRDPKVELAYSQSRQIDDTGRVLAENYLDYTRDISPTKWLRPYVRSGIDEIRDTLAIKNTIPNVSAVLMRRPDPLKLEAVQAGLRVAGDWLTYVQVLCKGKIAYFPEALNSHRRHHRGVTLASDDLTHLKEIRTAQQLVAARFEVAEAVGAQAACYLQSIYEHFGLHERGPKHFFEHPALQDPGAIGGQ